MKTRVSAGQIFLNRKRAASPGLALPESWKNAWRGSTGVFRRHPDATRRILYAAAAGIVLFDFVSFSVGSLPSTPAAVEVRGARRIGDDIVRTEILRKFRAAHAENLIEVNLRDLSDHLLRRIPAIRSSAITVNVGRGVMTVAVEERAAVGVVQTPGGILEFDKEGMLYPALGAPKVPLLQVWGLAGSEVAAGRNVYEHPAGAGLLRVLSAFPADLKNHLAFVRVIQPDYLELVLDGSLGVLVKVDPASFPEKVDRMAKLVRKHQGGGVAYIDFRFRQEVIRFAEGQKQAGKGKTGR